jgi:hypothetical protein
MNDESGQRQFSTPFSYNWFGSKPFTQTLQGLETKGLLATQQSLLKLFWNVGQSLSLGPPSVLLLNPAAALNSISRHGVNKSKNPNATWASLRSGAAGSSHLGAQTCRPDTMGVNNPTMVAMKRTERGIALEVNRNCWDSRKFYDPNLVEKKAFLRERAL